MKCLSGLVMCFLAASCVTAAESAPKSESQQLAKNLLSMAGCNKGLCCVPRCGDGELAVAIAQNSGMTVYGLEESTVKIELARKTACAANLLGKRLYFDVATSLAIPLTDDYVDLMIIADADDTGLAAISATEILRVLAPGLGQAIIGRAKLTAAKGELTRDGLKKWLMSAGLDDATIKQTDDGLWATFQRPALPGADDWTHWDHGPDNNPASLDTAYGYPDAIQYMGRPFFVAYPGGSNFVLAAGGRYFNGYSGTGSMCGEKGAEAERTLHVCEGYNGRPLWTHPLPANTVWWMYSLDLWVATHDKFYMVDNAKVVILDAATGKESGRLECGAPDEQIGWLSVVDGTAYALVGKKAEQSAPGKMGSGTRLAAFDLQRNEKIWEHQEPTYIAAHGVGLDAGRLYFCAPKSRVAALDRKTGTVLWSRDNLNQPEDNNIYSANVKLVCQPKAIIVLFSAGRDMFLFSPDDGHEIWKRKSAGGMGMLILGDKLISNSAGAMSPADLMSGDALPQMDFLRGGCGRVTASPGYAFGTSGGVTRLEDNLKACSEYQRMTCAVGSVIANGVRYGNAHGCRCPKPFRGVLAWRPVSKSPLPPPAFPLETFDSAEPPQVTTTLSDWSEYRHDLAHSGSSPAAIGLKALATQWRVPSPDTSVPTQALTVNGQLILAGNNGVIRCLDQKDGKEQWTYHAGGRITFPPTVNDSRVYAGCSDGYVYCLAIANGKLLWRLRAAPADRRMFVYDDLMSRWPVNSNIVVKDGTAYATAGLMDHEGVYVHAMDARTGKLKWSSDALGKLWPEDYLGVDPRGGMTLAGNWLWLKVDKGHFAALDIRTGALQAPIQDLPVKMLGATPDKYAPWGKVPDIRGYEQNMGKDIGVFGGKLLVEFGRHPFSDEAYRTVPSVLTLDQDGGGHLPRFVINEPGGPIPVTTSVPGGVMPVSPAWDDALFVGSHGFVYGKNVPTTLFAWTSAGLLKCVADARQPFVEKLTALKEKGKPIQPGDVRPLKLGIGYKLANPSPAAAWINKPHDAVAMVLCSDALVIAEPIAPAGKISPFQLTALNRDTGEAIWHTPLPAEPVKDGLSIDRNGCALVVFTDGSVASYGVTNLSAVQIQQVVATPRDADERKLPELKVTPVKNAPKIDGVLDDAAWIDVATTDNFRLNDGSKPEGRTKLFVTRDDKNLYISVECFETAEAIKSLQANATKHDADEIWSGDDSIDIFIDPTNKRQSYYQIIVNTKGVVWDAWHQSPGNAEKRWDVDAKIAVKIGATSWTCEMAIPFSAFSNTNKFESEWAFNVSRMRTSAFELTYWSPVYNQSSHHPEYFGTLSGMLPTIPKLADSPKSADAPSAGERSSKH